MEGGCYGCGDENPAGLGMTFAVEAPGVVASFTPRADHRGAPGFLHGGVAATCLDEAMGALPYLLDEVACVTATLHVRYRQPVPIDGQPLRVEAWRVPPEPRRRQRLHARIVLGDGTVAVEAEGIFVQVHDGPQAWRPR